MTKPITFLDIGATYRELKDELDEATARVLESGWYILGPEVEAFESAFADYVGAKHCVGVANGLEALTLGLDAMGVGAGDEVIVPSNTYIATWLAVSRLGATPVPVEPDPATCNIDPARIEAAITKRTKVILPVHLYGQAAAMGPICNIADKHGLQVLDDAAQAHGARWEGARLGNWGNMTAWSFYPGKNLGAFGDAGGITTNDDALADRMRVLRNYGSHVKYHNDVQGWNSRLAPIQAAALSVKLKRLDAWNARRQSLAAIYDSLLGHDVVTPLRVAPGADSVWHLYVVRTENRDGLQTYLKEHGIQTLIHYPVAPHLQPAYAELGLAEGSLPISEEIHRTCLSLPISPHHTEQDVTRVCEAVQRWHTEHMA